MVGLVAAKGLALAAGKPLVAVNHLEGHALSPLLADPDLGFPYLLLLVSGGHCQLLVVRGRRRLPPARHHHRRCRRRGVRQDREAARPRLSRRPGGRGAGGARAIRAPCRCRGRCSARPSRISPSPASRARCCAPSRQATTGREDIAASFQQAVVDCLVDRTALALRRSEAPALVVAGGVAANQRDPRRACATLAASRGRAYAPPPWLCTDNAAMIAWAGAERFAAGLCDGLDAPARARWPLDEAPRRCAARGSRHEFVGSA